MLRQTVTLATGIFLFIPGYIYIILWLIDDNMFIYSRVYLRNPMFIYSRVYLRNPMDPADISGIQQDDNTQVKLTLTDNKSESLF